MIIENPSDYTLQGFRKSKTKGKKYDAILSNKKTKKLKHIPFGDSKYEQYKDTTGLFLYSHKNHNDENRRDLYRKRHDADGKNKYSSGWFALNYLWS